MKHVALMNSLVVMVVVYKVVGYVIETMIVVMVPMKVNVFQQNAIQTNSFNVQKNIALLPNGAVMVNWIVLMALMNE